ncbi:MAG: tetratricopeptide repeat protein [Candidatus Sericytochromatia bacterium]
MSLAQQLEVARQHHINQRLQEAEIIYRAILKLEPENAEALQLLGVLVAQAGQPEQGLSLLEQARRLAPDRPEIDLNFGAVLRQLGRMEEALSLYRQLELRYPDFAQALFHIGELGYRLGHQAEAETHLLRWLELNPQHLDALNILASLYQAQGRWQEAESMFNRALALEPAHPVLRFNLANLHWCQGRHHEAAAEYRRLLAQHPQHLMALCNLAGALRELGNYAEAETCLQEASVLAPASAQPLVGLGNLAMEQRRPEQAEAAYRQALDRDPACFDAWVNLGVLRQQQGETDAARASFDRALALQPDNLDLRLRRATMLPVLLETAAQAVQLRQQLQQDLADFENASGQLEDPVRQLRQTPFFLAYHGLDDRPLQERMNRLYRRLAPTLNFQIPPRRSLRRQKLRLGFVSDNLKFHTIGLLMGGLVEHLPREHFEITLFHFPSCQDPLARHLQAVSDRAIALPYQLEQAQNLIAASELDLLFYPDIGLSTFTYCLAFSRLAPVQCTTWGHSVTSGLDTIDYFFSSHVLEPADPQRFYTERLVLMEELIPFYTFPPLPAGSLLDLPEGRLYLCPQSLFKLHPDFDQVLAQILEADPQAQILFLEGHQPHWKQLLLARWQPLMQSRLERVHFLPRLIRPDFLALLARADVILDPFHFCGGNSTYEALAAGTPVVTLPGDFLRGRITYALYQRMGLDGAIAGNPDEFVEIALKLAQDRAFNQEFRAAIHARRGSLYSNHKAISELAGLLLEKGSPS